MAKMMKPEVEAIRFGEVDVIATSGMVVGNNYVTVGRELNQAGFQRYIQAGYQGGYYDAYPSDDVVPVTCNGDSQVAPSALGGSVEGPYVWYNKSTGTWGTEGWTLYDYGARTPGGWTTDIGKLPEGND